MVLNYLSFLYFCCCTLSSNRTPLAYQSLHVQQIILFNFFQIHYDATSDTISSSISAGLRHVVPHAGTVIQQCQNQFLVQYHFPALTAYPLICLNSALSIFSELCHLHYPVYICHHLQETMYLYVWMSLFYNTPQGPVIYCLKPCSGLTSQNASLCTCLS